MNRQHLRGAHGPSLQSYPEAGAELTPDEGVAEFAFRTEFVIIADLLPYTFRRKHASSLISHDSHSLLCLMIAS
jgi:hypothetical protein